MRGLVVAAALALGVMTVAPMATAASDPPAIALAKKVMRRNGDFDTARSWLPHEAAVMANSFAAGAQQADLTVNQKALDKAVRRSRAKLTPDRVGYMAHADWVSRPSKQPPRKLWRPEVPTLAGLKATAAWYREQGWL